MARLRRQGLEELHINSGQGPLAPHVGDQHRRQRKILARPQKVGWRRPRIGLPPIDNDEPSADIGCQHHEVRVGCHDRREPLGITDSSGANHDPGRTGPAPALHVGTTANPTSHLDRNLGDT